MQKGKIIFLNGVSSSGKTTLAKELQERLIEPYYGLSIDTFAAMLPYKFGPHNIREGYPIFLKAVSMMPYTIKAFSDMGLNTIADHVITHDDCLQECVETLYEHPVLFVHVTCPLEELLRREKERGDRHPQAEATLPRLLPQNTYDITVDTHNNTKQECAANIIKMLNYPEKFTAFKMLWSHRT